jgi:hypothetical protein
MPELFESGQEWSSTPAPASLRESLHSSPNVLIEIEVEGAAAAAGISFGDYKDFLVPLHKPGKRFLQFAIDRAAGTWRFRVDGTIAAPHWWNARVKSVADLSSGELCVKAQHAKGVTFRDLRVVPLESSCRVSVVMVSNRFAKRLRLALGNWVRQRVPSGALEVIVVNPSSPDATHDVVRNAAIANPAVRLCELEVSTRLARNKGAMINRGVAASRGEWIWLTDADCLFPPNAVASVLGAVDGRDTFFYCERRHLTDDTTAELIDAGEVGEFEHLAQRVRGDVNVCPWGYCQILHRSLFERVRYREDLNAFSDSDNSFVDACRRRGAQPVRLDDLFCLHLVHPFAWGGTNAFL